MSNYPGQNILIEYLKEQGSKSSYCGFLKFSSKFITALISPTDTCDRLDTIWFYHFLWEAKSLFNQETYVVIKNKFLQNFWQRIIKEHKKENLVPSDKTSDIKSSEISQLNRIIRTYKKESLAPNVTSQLNETSNIKSSEISQPKKLLFKLNKREK
ncbi:18855_t:CDS:2, partial [Rhizophagus irregularis]